MPPFKLYKAIQNCSKCCRSRMEGATLLRCKACGVNFYCGKECQKADWPVHKIKCKNHQEARRDLSARPQVTAEFDALERWKRVHRPAIEFLSIQELGLCDDPSRGEHTVFKFCVQLRPQETNPRKKFEVTEAVPCPITHFGIFSLWIQMKYEEAELINAPLNLSTCLIVFMREGSPVPNIVKLGLEPGFYKSPPPYIAPGEIIDDINNGEVC